MAPFRSRFPFVSPHFGFGFGFLFVVCYTVYCTYISLCCVFCILIFISWTRFLMIFWVFRSTKPFSQLRLDFLVVCFFFASFCFAKTFLNEIFLIYVFGIFFYFLFGILAHSCPLYTPLCDRCCCLLCPLRRVEFFFCFWQIVSNEFSLDTAGFFGLAAAAAVPVVSPTYFPSPPPGWAI